MGARLRHFKTICKHKAIVFRECRACGIAWQGLIHDLSKFSITEFSASAKYFQGNRSPIEAEKEDTDTLSHGCIIRDTTSIIGSGGLTSMITET
jgi:hypothetical protein